MNDWLLLLETVRVSWKKVGSPSPVTAAVSGGADSVALLHALRALSEEQGFKLSAAHVDHGLRPASGEDAAFVAQMCRALDVPCRVIRVQVKGKSEDAARTARYEALREACLENGAAALALAHHLRDQAETVLLHLFRGSGGGGLSAMAERSWLAGTEGERLVLWRPWLSVSPEVICAALREKDIPWREDETNAGDAYLRNYIRHQVLPAVSARIPRAEEAVGRAARILAEEEAYFRQEAKLFLERENNACLCDPCRWVRYVPLLRLHPALRRHALRLACPVKMDWETTERLASLSPGGIINLPEGWRAQCTQEYLHFLPPDEAAISSALPMPGTLTARPWRGETGSGFRVQAMKKSVYGQCRLRRWEPGDRIHPLGTKGSKSLQDYFVDKKVPRPFRRHVPLLCIGARVVWAIGLGVGEEARVSPGDDAVLVRYEGFLPGDAAMPENEREILSQFER